MAVLSLPMWDGGKPRNGPVEHEILSVVNSSQQDQSLSWKKTRPIATGRAVDVWQFSLSFSANLESHQAAHTNFKKQDSKFILR